MHSNTLIVTPQREEDNVSRKEYIVKMINECLLADERSHHLCVDWLARFLHMSRPTLYRKVKSITGLTPNELISEARLNRAAALLAGGIHRSCEVAKMVGYTSQSSFGKSFLKQFKVTPAQYQRMKRVMEAV